MEFSVQAYCPICEDRHEFTSRDDFWSCRDELKSENCGLGGCITRERALAHVLFTLSDRESVRHLSIHEAGPMPRGLSAWLTVNAKHYVRSGFYPTIPPGDFVGEIKNENLEAQTFGNGVFDVVIHLDVMEHVFEPFKALNEIHRTLRLGGYCLFTAPTEHARFQSEQVAFVENGVVRTVGEAEYHANPQRPEDGALVTWRYGYDLPLLIQRNTPFDVEVRRFQARGIAVMGYMNEVYVLRRRI
ncbi:MAG: methyltransferase type 11 [Acidobacteria bacterium]|nr:MAG: methyltransferase type 11 [Acidobacteriota bacterium]